MQYELNNDIKQGIESGHNLIISGAAGTAKSTNIRSIIRDYGQTKKIVLCSTTGISAVNIGGQTLHSFLNIGLCKTNDIQREFQRIVNSPYNKWEQVRQADILIIDECSMLDGFLFTLIEQILRRIRKNEEPFGNLQVCMFGDLYQLPPVQVEQNKYFFETETFAFGNFKPIVLKKIYRQEDRQFIDVLNRIRIGKQTQSDIDWLNKRDTSASVNYALLDTTCLFPTNAEANKLNEYRLNQLDGELYEFMAEDVACDYRQRMETNIFTMSDEVKEQMIEQEEQRLTVKYNKYLRVPEKLQLKEGARVILLYNVDVKRGLCNGTTGKFKRKEGNLLICEFNNREEAIERHCFEVYEHDLKIFTRNQYPLRLGYGITIHSSQGMTLNSVAINFSKIFSACQAYVALSRCKSYDGLYLKNLSMDKVFIDNRVVEFMNRLEEYERITNGTST